MTDKLQTREQMLADVTTSEQQAVPVAQEDRNFAADYGIRFGRFGELYRRAIEDGQWDHTDDVQLVARHRLASLTCKSGEGAGYGEGVGTVRITPEIDAALHRALLVSTKVVDRMDDPLERWPGYHDQTWQQRFNELNRRYDQRMVQLEVAQCRAALAALTPDATQTREAEFEQAMSAGRAQNPYEPFSGPSAVWNEGYSDCWSIARAALNARGGA